MSKSSLFYSINRSYDLPKLYIYYYLLFNFIYSNLLAGFKTSS